MSQTKIFPATMMPDKNWWSALWPDPDQIVRSMLIKPGMDVIDLGCGYGYFTSAIARQTKPGRAIGLDLDPEMLDQAQEACNGLVNCDWLLGDAMELHSIVRSSVDYVLIANTFHGAPDKTGLSQEVLRILKPTGLFSIINWYPIPREETQILGQPRGPATSLRMSPEQTASDVEQAGYKLKKLVKLPPYHYGVIFARI